jgi:hypothetical protein
VGQVSTTTAPPEPCSDTAPGIDTVRCRLDLLEQDLGSTPTTELGGAKVARKLGVMAKHARTLVGDPVNNRRLKAATKQLKRFASLLNHKLGQRKIQPDVGSELSTLDGSVVTELDGLVSAASSAR